jgi:phospholipid/cholesterol/gamma-HCH transport system substrate-binding protein
MTMDRDARINRAVGLFVVLALCGLAAGILSLSAEGGLFEPRYRVKARFNNVLGLLPGAPVWLGGKQVGRVEKIRFEPVEAERPVLVVLEVNESVQDRIRADSIATIGTIGLLGDAYVEVSFGTPAAARLESDEEIATRDPANVTALMAEGRSALASIHALSGSLNEVVKTFAENKGAERAVLALEAVSDIMIETREGSGLIHSLIFEPYDGTGLDELSASLAGVEEIVNEIRTGEGLLHDLIYEPVDDRRVWQDLAASTSSLQRILETVEQGDGTLGLLVNDPTVFESLQGLLGEARRSRVLRSLIRMSLDDADERPPADPDASGRRR